MSREKNTEKKLGEKTFVRWGTVNHPPWGGIREKEIGHTAKGICPFFKRKKGGVYLWGNGTALKNNVKRSQLSRKESLGATGGSKKEVKLFRRGRDRLEGEDRAVTVITEVYSPC